VTPGLAPRDLGAEKEFTMRWQGSLLILVLLACPAWAQTHPAGQPAPVVQPPATFDLTAPPMVPGGCAEPQGPGNGFLTGNHNFPGFINFVSNPLENIDPRAVTAVYPLYLGSWVSSVPAIPDGDIQAFGPAITIALSDRLAVGLNQGGYAIAHFDRGQAGRILSDPHLLTVRPDRRDRLRDVAQGGERDGFLNVGGFAQYTLIEDVENQFLLTGGVRLVVPCGAHEVFQGYGPAEMAPYLTAGKEFGEFHVLATVGYQFPVGPGSDNEQFFNVNLHLDRRFFGWLYPLVELNWILHTHSVGFDLPTRTGFADFDTFSATGDTLALAVGANAVLVPERFEVGAAYTTVLSGQNNLNVDGFIVKMTIRY
jgi:hypothetical protein